MSITKAQLDLCLARLRDPNSKPSRWQSVNGFDQNGAAINSPFTPHRPNSQALPATEPMCCVMHCAHVLGFDGPPHMSYEFMSERIGSVYVRLMVQQMDSEARTLPQIADWMEHIIPTEG